MSFSYPALVRAEIFRMWRQRSNWLLPLIPLGGLAVLAALTITSYGLTDLHGKTVLDATRDLTDTATLVLEMTLGITALMLAARSAAHDFQYGTIRLLIGGGAARTAILLAKLTASGIVSAVGLVFGLSIAAACLALLSPVIAHNLGSLPSIYWHEVSLDVVAIVVSVASCLVLGTFTSTVTRSMSAGLTAAMVWLPAENILVGIMAFVVATTHSDSVTRASGWLLAPNLNHLIQALEPWRSTVEFGARPLGETQSNPVGPVGAEQGLTAIAVWLAIFLVAGLFSVTARIDIKE